MKRVLISACLAAWWVIGLSGSAFGLPPVQRSVLKNGLVLLVSGERSLPIVTMHLIVRTGSKDDPKGKEGLADFTASSLLLGATGRSRSQINEELDFMGAHMSAGSNKDYTAVSLQVMKKDLSRAFPILIDVVTKPVFPDDEVRKEVSRTLGAIKSSEDQPGVVADRAFEKALYLGGPYGHSTEGARESVSRLKPHTLKTFHQGHYGPNNSILIVVGDVDDGTIKGYIIPILERWQRRVVGEKRTGSNGRVQEVSEKKAGGPAEKKIVRINRPVTQSNVIIGGSGMSRDNPDYYAATMMNHILGGGGLTSRLMEDIRTRKGLAYAVDSSFEPHKFAGSFQISLQTKTSSTNEAISAALEEVNRLRTELVSEQEFDQAGKYLVGSFPRRFSSQSRIASFFGQVEYYGLGLDYPDRYPSIINSLTREDIRRVAQNYLRPEAFVVVVVGDLKAAGMQ